MTHKATKGYARAGRWQEEQAGIESSLVKLLGCDAGELRVLVRLSLVQQLPMASLAGFAFNEHGNWCV